MAKFKTVNPKENFPEMENNLLSWWYKDGIVEKYLKRNDKSDKRFAFQDGPITANNRMGVHHAEARAFKDFYQRFKNMKGYKQRFQNGFDCQGLWVEVEVEKALGFNSKKDIIKYGMDNFVKACKERVNKYAGEITDQSKRLGMFMDWDNSYFTNSETNNMYIWHFFKVCQEKKLLYKSKSSTTWCPRCETGLSHHEKLDGYKTVEDESVYVKFQIKGKKNEYFLAWTTTPWTLSANVLLAINPEFEYVKAKVDGDTLYLAHQAAERLGFEDLEKVDATKLLGTEYDALYDIPAQEGIKHYVVEWDFVNPEEGTGIVHVAPGCGEEDFELGQKLGVPSLSPLSTAGIFEEGYGLLTGKYAHDVKEVVFDHLKEIGAFFKSEPITHSYPFCWRCGTKCLFRLEDNWFINCQGLKNELTKMVKGAKWIPDFAEKRALNWLDNMGDWMISRKRFYGLALPFYECKKCGELTIAGSKEELRKLAVDPKKVDDLPSPHRPWIDEIKVKCPKCGEVVERIPDVGDVWLDAGVVPFSTLKYLDDRKYWEQWYPAELVTEMIEQVRLWYYSMMVYAVVFGEKAPFINVLSGIEIRDENGERMSKSKGNAPAFDEAADKAGSDLIRWLYASQSVYADYLRFGYTMTDDIKRRFYLLLWNSFGYFVTYANLFDWDQSKFKLPKNPNILDKWLLFELDDVTATLNAKLEAYDTVSVCKRVEKFVNDLSTWYIRRSRDRFRNGDNDALSVLYYSLFTLTKLLAPLMPFITEEIYQTLRSKNDPESVHLCDYPEAKKILDKDRKIQHDMDLVREAASLGLSARTAAKMKVRQPLGEVVISGINELPEGLVKVLSEELNIRSVKFAKNLPEGKNWIVSESNGIKLALNTEIPEDLLEEGLYREVSRRIQQARKNVGLAMGEPVDTVIGTEDEKIKNLVEKRKEELSKSLSLKAIAFDKPDAKIKSTKDKIFVTIKA